MSDARLHGARSPNLLAEVIELAYVADPEGRAHASRVMVAVGGEDAKVVAALHDLVLAGELRTRAMAAMPERLLMALAAFERAGEDDRMYFDAILLDPLALQVKMACVGDRAFTCGEESDEIAARRRRKDLEATASKLGTTLSAVLNLWDSGRSEHT